MSSCARLSALARIRGLPQPVELDLEAPPGCVLLEGVPVRLTALAWEVPAPGQVFGVALNFRGLHAAMAEAFHAPPYDEPPKAPVLYIKPRNTRLAHGMPVPLPADAEEVLIGATLGVVIGRSARNVDRSRAHELIAGYTIVNDLTIPHASLFRPPLRCNARDGFGPIGPWMVARDALPEVDSLAIRAWVNGELRMTNTTANLVRDVGRLIAEVTEFMTLDPGDVLTVGVPENPPRARAGDLMAVEIEGLGRLENRLVREAELAGAGGPP